MLNQVGHRWLGLWQGIIFKAQPTAGRWGYTWALGVVAACTLLAGLLLPYFALSNLIMVYLLGVVVVAIHCTRGPSILASVLSVAAFDFFYVPPYLSFAVSDTQYLVTFGVMFIVAITISGLTAHIREQAGAAYTRERHTASLYSLSREFANTLSPSALLRVASRHIADAFSCQVVAFLPDEFGNLAVQTEVNGQLPLTPHEQSIAQWVYEHQQAAGLGMETLASANGLYMPLIALHGTMGVLSLYPKYPDYFTTPQQMTLLKTFVNQTAIAIERTRLSEETARTLLNVETERLRNALLSSVSHDLRTPLAAITGAASSLIEDWETLDANACHELAQMAYDEAERMNRLIGNLLAMTKFESGTVKAEKEWQPLEEVIGTALNRLGRRFEGRVLQVDLPADLSLVPLDGTLIEQVFVNLLENALKYTSLQTSITLSAHQGESEVIVEVLDRGIGLVPGDEQRIFDKFYRSQPANGVGTGLGLTICHGIVQAHGGRIWAENRAGGGAAFRFTLPLDGQPPQVSPENE